MLSISRRFVNRRAACSAMIRIFAGAAAAALLAACATGPPVEKVDSVTVCVGGQCAPAAASLSVAQLTTGLSRLMLAAEKQPYTICEADPKTRACDDNDISMFVQGGPIPGVGSMGMGRILSVTPTPAAGTLSYSLNTSMTFIGVPLITTDHDAVIRVSDDWQVRLVENDYYTNWMAVGNQLMSFSMAADWIDLDRSRLGGYYSWASTGIGMGKGSGYAVIQFSGAPGNGAGWLDPVALATILEARNTPARAVSAAAPSATAAPTGDGAPALTQLRDDLIQEQHKLQAEKEQAQVEAEKIRVELARLQAELERQKTDSLKQEAARQQAELELEKTRARYKADALQQATAEKARLAAEARQRQEEALKRKAYTASFGRYFALVIGNNQYRSLPPLKSALNDARTLSGVLADGYGFIVTLLENASRSDVLNALSRYRRELDANDNLLVFYAGHGWLDKAGDEGYWLPVDADMSSEVNWISNATVTTALKAMKAKHVLVIADSCYAGKLVRGVTPVIKTPDHIAKLAKLRARVVMTSGGVEPVLDSGGKGDHSVFTAALLQALTDNRDVLQALELFHEIQRPVMVNADQTPQYADIRNADHEGGDFLFIRQDR
ncbi:MAG: caspase family protein [Pseudomonadota bacterium]